MHTHFSKAHYFRLRVAQGSTMLQGSTQGTQIIRVDPEQPVKCFRVSRNCFLNYSWCYKKSQVEGDSQARCYSSSSTEGVKGFGLQIGKFA